MMTSDENEGPMVSRFGRPSLLLALLAMLLMVPLIGCNEESDFDPEELFSIEDYATDSDYAVSYIIMMNDWTEAMRKAKGYLDTNVEGLTFTESIPAGWEMVDPERDTYPWPQGIFGDEWYVKSFQDTEFEFISVNREVPGDNDLDPARIDYMRLEFLASVYGGNLGVGDSVGVEYSDNFANPSALTGGGGFWNNILVTAQDAPTDIAAYATMTNIWHGDFTNLSPELDNPQGEFSVAGQTVLVRADLAEQATLNVSIEASVRSNAKGEATIRVNGIERARVIFEYYDTFFHGYYLLRESGFKEAIRF